MVFGISWVIFFDCICKGFDLINSLDFVENTLPYLWGCIFFVVLWCEILKIIEKWQD